jgi:cytochrome c biogenesis protein CcmG/thiol:disulfide interchange protein DsbE
MVKPLMLAPPLIFAGLALLFFAGMQRSDPDQLPSTFIGRPAPPLASTALPGFAMADDAMLQSGEITLVNFWATWCPPCRAEHPELLRLARERGVRIVGVNIRDDAGNAVRYLTYEGNPFIGITADLNMRTAIDWGVTAPPETFIIGTDGTVLFRFVGPLVGTDFENRFLPALETALAVPK